MTSTVPMRARVAIAASCVLASSVALMAGVVSTPPGSSIATFDELDEGFYGLSLNTDLVSGGVRFFQPWAGASVPFGIWAVDDGTTYFNTEGLGLKPEAAGKVLNLGSIGEGPDSTSVGGFVQLSMSIDLPSEYGAVSVLCVPFAGRDVWLEALQGDTVVASTRRYSDAEAFVPGQAFGVLRLELSATFDSLRLRTELQEGVTSAPGVDVDNVVITPVPGPAAGLTLTLATACIARSRRRQR